MTVTLTDPIVAPSRLTAAQVRAWYVDNWGPVPTPVADYLAEAERLCTHEWRTFPMDLLIFVAQSIVETADPDTGKPWMSARWIRNHNPAGLAVESDNDPDPATFTATEAATVQYWAWLYMTRKTSTQVFPPESANSFVERWTAKVHDPNFPYPIRTVADLCRHYVDESGDPQATWAWDQTYATQIIARANDLLRFAAAHPEGGTTPVTTQTVTFGRVPKPPIIELICSKIGPGHGYTQVPPRQNVGICEHITDGRGSVEFYHDFFSIGGEREADALVDFVVGRDGRIAMLNDWRGTRAPWANGNTAGQEGDGPAFIATFGIAGVNNRLVSIEHEGRAAEDWTGEQWNASVALDAWLFDQMGVSFDSFPVHQSYGVVTHLLHSEFTDKGGNALDECPGRYLKQHINQFQAAIKAVMMAHQVDAPATPDKPKPAPIWWDRDDIGVQVNGNGDRALAMLAETQTRDKEATLYSVAVAKKQYALGTVKPRTILTLRGTSRSKAGRRFAFVEIPGHPDQVARIVASNLVETWPNL